MPAAEEAAAEEYPADVPAAEKAVAEEYPVNVPAAEEAAIQGGFAELAVRSCFHIQVSAKHLMLASCFQKNIDRWLEKKHHIFPIRLNWDHYRKLGYWSIHNFTTSYLR